MDTLNLTVVKMDALFYFNVNDGYIEAILRGLKDGLLTSTQYQTLTQCESLEDLKLQLAATDYGNFLENEPPPLLTTTIAQKCIEKLVKEFHYLRAHSTQPLTKFLDYITYGYMIDNVMLLILGTLRNRDTRELLERCNPLGIFDTMATLCVATNVTDLYNVVLVETPLAPYFKNCLSASDLDELNVEIIRNSVYKAYLEDFYEFCKTLPGCSFEVMSELISFEADRRAINITINSFGTELSKDERSKLYPTCGRLYPEGLANLSRADDVDQVRLVCDRYAEYRGFFDTMGISGADQSLEDKFFEYEVRANKLSFYQQFHYGIFYSYLKLKEQEIRNILWIAECIHQKQKDKVNNFIHTF